MRAKSIDDLRWPYKISPIQAYLFGVLTVWALYILYHFIIFAIYSARRRIKKGKKTSSKRTGRSRRLIREGDSIQTSHSFRPCAPMAKIPISPVYQPSKFSKARVHRKLSKKIRDRSKSRRQRKSRRQLRSMRAKKASATLLPTSPTYELFQHMNSHPLTETGRVNKASDIIVTHESKHSFVTTSMREIPHGNQRSKLGNAMDNFVGEEGRMTVDSSLDNNVGGPCGSSDSGKNIENRSTVYDDEMKEGKDMHSDCTAIDISSTLINSSKDENDNTAEKYWDQEILFANAEKSLDQEIDKENIPNFSQKESSITKTLTVLVSNGIYDYTQKAQQREVLDLLTDLEIPHMTIDGMDQLQREKRDYFFGVSGVRGNYPQIFSSYEGNHTYLGGYDWMQSITFDELRKIVA